MKENLCSLNDSATNEKDIVDLRASSSMGWQRIGSGRVYNSISGHGVVIGTKKEKILSMEWKFVLASSVR